MWVLKRFLQCFAVWLHPGGQQWAWLLVFLSDLALGSLSSTPVLQYNSLHKSACYFTVRHQEFPHIDWKYVRCFSVTNQPARTHVIMSHFWKQKKFVAHEVFCVNSLVHSVFPEPVYLTELNSRSVSHTSPVLYSETCAPTAVGALQVCSVKVVFAPMGAQEYASIEMTLGPCQAQPFRTHLVQRLSLSIWVENMHNPMCGQKPTRAFCTFLHIQVCHDTWVWPAPHQGAVGRALCGAPQAAEDGPWRGTAESLAGCWDGLGSPVLWRVKPQVFTHYWTFPPTLLEAVVQLHLRAYPKVVWVMRLAQEQLGVVDFDDL